MTGFFKNITPISDSGEMGTGMVLNIIVSNCLIIDIDEMKSLRHGESILKGVEKLLTYKNPSFQEALKWGYSTWGIPSHLYSYEYAEDNRSMFISRGARDRVESYIKKFEIEIHYIDQTLVSPLVAFDHSKVILRPDQQEAVRTMMRYEQGILIAYTSFGKTLAFLELMRLLRQRSLVVVHTTFLQEQWIKEATDPRTFNMPMDRIGGVGGVFKKRKLGDFNVCLYHSLSKDDHLNFFRPHVGLIGSDEAQKSPIADIQKVVNMFPARHRYAVSARIERKDGKEFLTLDTFGSIRHVAVEKEGSSKIISTVTIIPTGYEDLVPELDHEEDREARDQDSYVGMLSRMAADKERNIMICKIAISKIRQGKLVIIFVERKEQAGYLMKMLSKFKGDMLIGSTDPKSVNSLPCPQSVKDVLNNFDHEGAFDRITRLAEHKELQFIIGTSKAEVGLSIRTLDVGIVTTPVGKNLERFNQIKGRLERTYSEEQEKFFGHKKERPELIVIKDKTKSSREAASCVREAYGELVKEIKRKTENSNVQIRRKT